MRTGRWLAATSLSTFGLTFRFPQHVKSRISANLSGIVYPWRLVSQLVKWVVAGGVYAPGLAHQSIFARFGRKNAAVLLVGRGVRTICRGAPLKVIGFWVRGLESIMRFLSLFHLLLFSILCCPKEECRASIVTIERAFAVTVLLRSETLVSLSELILCFGALCDAGPNLASDH